MRHIRHSEWSQLILQFHDKLPPLTFPQFGNFHQLSPLVSLNVFSPLHGSLPLLMLPVIYSIHPRTTAGLFSEHYSLFSPLVEKPQQGELIGSRGTQPPSCQRILKREKKSKVHPIRAATLVICTQTQTYTEARIQTHTKKNYTA